MLLIVTRFVTISGGIAEIIAPGHTDTIFHISEVALILFCIFGMWFSHETLRLKWGGLPTKIIYIVTLGLPLILAAGTGKAAGTWWFMFAQTPHFFIITKGILSKSCRANPYALLYIGAETLLMATPFIMMIPALPPLYMPYIPFWLFFMLVQAVILSQSYGEAKRREKELTEEKRLLEKLNHTKSEFFGNISHEIKTPLTIIVTDMELAGQLIDEGKQYCLLRIVRKSRATTHWR